MTPIRILSISDIHFGNTQLDPVRLADNFRTQVLPQLATTDLLIVAGDFFDTALALSDTITPSVVAVMFDLLAAAAWDDVTVRFLRGTFSHERTQGAYFPLLHKQYGFANDLRYIDTISLEYIERFDLRLLYLPDDLPYPNAAAVLAVVQQKLYELGWDYVDYAIIHGYLEHVVPVGAIQPKNTYTQAMFDFVRRYVVSGHVHTPSIVGKFLYNGSFDRLAHGEEEPKGFMRIEDDGTTSHVHFVANPNATRFITLDCTTAPDDDAAMQQFCATVQSCPMDTVSHVRVFHKNTAWRQGLLRFSKQQYPHLRLIVKPPREQVMVDPMQDAAIVDFSSFPRPTSETLPALILEHGDLTTKPMSLTEEKIRKLLRLAAQP